MRPTKNKPKKDKKNKFVVSPRPKKKINDTKQIKPKKIEISEDILLGRNAVREALKSGRSINRILIADSAHGGSMPEIMTLAKERRIIVQNVNTEKLDQICGGQRHQGIAAYAAPVDYVELDDILNLAKERNEDPFIILLDELEDPHNLGAILRTADAVGAHGILIPKHRSCPLSSIVAKTSAGALEYVPVARVNNISKEIEKLKKQGLWIACADMKGTDCFKADLKGAIGIVIGNEGDGVSRLVKESCDYSVKIPMYGNIESLNASVAAGLLMYEVVRQRKFVL